MQGIAKAYAEFHGVTISPEIARQCVILSERYISDRFLPDKAIDLLDEACSDLNLRCKEISLRAEKKKERPALSTDRLIGASALKTFFLALSHS